MTDTPSRHNSPTNPVRTIRTHRVSLPNPSAVPTTPTTTTLTDARDTVLAQWRRENLDQRLAGWPELVTRFVDYCAATNIISLDQITVPVVSAWINALLSARSNRVARRAGTNAAGRPVSDTTKTQRRSALRRFFRDLRGLSLYHADPTMDIGLPARESRLAKPLTHEEIRRVRTTCRDTPHQTLLPASVALTLATATTAELACIRLTDLHLNAARVWIHSDSGGHHPRWGELDEWGLAALQRRVAYLTGIQKTDPAQLVVYTRDPATKLAARTAATAGSLRRVLELAQITRRDAIPASFLDYVAAQILNDTGRIEAVAARLGLRSLDRAEQVTGYTWREHWSIASPNAENIDE